MTTDFVPLAARAYRKAYYVLRYTEKHFTNAHSTLAESGRIHVYNPDDRATLCGLTFDSAARFGREHPEALIARDLARSDAGRGYPRCARCERKLVAAQLHLVDSRATARGELRLYVLGGPHAIGNLTSADAFVVLVVGEEERVLMEDALLRARDFFTGACAYAALEP